MNKLFSKLIWNLCFVVICGNLIAKEIINENNHAQKASNKITTQKSEQSVFYDCECMNDMMRAMPSIVSEEVRIDWIDGIAPLDVRYVSVLDRLKINIQKILERLSSLHWGLISSEITRSCGARGMNREWKGDIPKNIHANVVIPSSFCRGNNRYLSLLMHRAISVAVYNVCQRLMKKYAPQKADKVKLKWPNDVIINEKKICGIKPDEYVKNDQICSYRFALNVNMSEKELAKIDQPATSLSVECGKTFDHNEVLKDIMIELISIMKKYQHDISGLDSEFSDHMAFIGEEVVVYDADPGVNIQGILEKVEMGYLFIKEGSGDLKSIRPGFGILRKVNP